MIVSVDEYIDLIGAEDSKKTTLLASCLEAAQAKIEDHVGYSLELKDYEKTFTYHGSRIINLGVYQINTISSVSVSGETLDESEYSLDGYFLTIAESVWLEEGAEIVVKFKAGWIGIDNPDSLESDLPSAFRLAICFIARALSKNTGVQGIAPSANFGEGNMTFDLTRYYKFYDLVDGYKIARL